MRVAKPIQARLQQKQQQNRQQQQPQRRSAAAAASSTNLRAKIALQQAKKNVQKAKRLLASRKNHMQKKNCSQANRTTAVII